MFKTDVESFPNTTDDPSIKSSLINLNLTLSYLQNII